MRGVRTKNWANTQLYCEQLEKGKRAIESSEELPPLKRAGETAAFGLRMNAGWPFEEFRRTTNFDLRQEWSAEMNQLADRGWAKISPDNLFISRIKDCALRMRRRKCFCVEMCGDSAATAFATPLTSFRTSARRSTGSRR